MYLGTVVMLVVLFFTVILTTTYQNMERGSNDAIRSIEREPKNKDPHAMNDSITLKFPPPINIILDDKEEIIHVKSLNELSNDYYTKLIKAALTKGTISGQIKISDTYYKYRIIHEKNFIFLDITKDIHMFYNLINTFVWIAIPVLIIMWFLGYYFAHNSIKPIEMSFNKQREFIANASHQLKTPLTAISANVDVLLECSNDSEKKWLLYIKSETERMTSLTTSLLYLTKMDFKGLNTNRVSFDLSSLFTRYLLSLDAVFYENKIKTKINIMNDIKIYADADQINQVIDVLIDNAIKYTGGEIEISLEKAHNYAIITVYNNGEGINSNELTKIWDRFYRCDKSSAITNGFGLGLPIAKSIVETYNGKISAESEAGKWTRFIVKIPIT